MVFPIPSGLAPAAKMISWGAGLPSLDKDSGVIIPETETWFGLLGALLLLAK